MKLSHNEIAGQSVERLAALSDGIFAVAITLLVLDLRSPALEVVHSDQDLWRALVAISPRVLVYLLSFMTLGIFWIRQQTQLNHLERSNRSLTWIHLAFLFAVTLTLFSTTLLAEFLAYRLALVTYWLNPDARSFAVFHLAVRSPQSPGTRRHASRSTSGYQAPDPCRISLVRSRALLSVWSTYWSIAFIVVMQVNYSVAPRLLRRPKSYRSAGRFLPPTDTRSGLRGARTSHGRAIPA